MKWLKLDVDYGDDSKVCELAREIGSDAARAFWPMLMGYVYKHMGDTPARVRIRMTGPADRSTGERTLVDLAEHCHSFPKTVTARLDLCAAIGLIDKVSWLGQVRLKSAVIDTQSTLTADLIDTQVPVIRELFLPNILKRLKVASKKPEDLPPKLGTDDSEDKNVRGKEEEERGTLALVQSMFAAYNENRGALPLARELTKERTRKARARLASHEADRQGYVEQFKQGVIRGAASAFLCGTNDRKWKADFGWFVENDTNLVKVLEGKYDNGPGGNGNGGGGGRAFQGDDYTGKGNELFER